MEKEIGAGGKDKETRTFRTQMQTEDKVALVVAVDVAVAALAKVEGEKTREIHLTLRPDLRWLLDWKWVAGPDLVQMFCARDTTLEPARS